MRIQEDRVRIPTSMCLCQLLLASLRCTNRPQARPEATGQGLFISIFHMTQQAHRDEK